MLRTVSAATFLGPRGPWQLPARHSAAALAVSSHPAIFHLFIPISADNRQRGMTVAVLSVLAGPSSLSFPRPSTSAISAASSFGTGLGHEQTTAQACTC